MFSFAIFLLFLTINLLKIVFAESRLLAKRPFCREPDGSVHGKAGPPTSSPPAHEAQLPLAHYPLRTLDINSAPPHSPFFSSRATLLSLGLLLSPDRGLLLSFDVVHRSPPSAPLPPLTGGEEQRRTRGAALAAAGYLDSGGGDLEEQH
jgi:hypothetical protein